MTEQKQIDRAHWMSDLSENLRNIPIIYLAIPGNSIFK